MTAIIAAAAMATIAAAIAAANMAVVAVGCHKLLYLGRCPALLRRLVEHGARKLEVTVTGGSELGESDAAKGAQLAGSSHTCVDVCERVSRITVRSLLMRESKGLEGFHRVPRARVHLRPSFHAHSLTSAADRAESSRLMQHPAGTLAEHPGKESSKPPISPAAAAPALRASAAANTSEREVTTKTSHGGASRAHRKTTLAIVGWCASC